MTNNKNTYKKELTGYPSIDKPHERFYRKTPVRDINVNQTIYEMVFNSNKQNMTEPALEYMGIIWSFEKLKLETDKAACAFRKSGLIMGDTVLIGMSNSPEAVVVLLALNKLGVASKWFDVRAGEKDIEDYANDNKCRFLIAFDLLIPRINLILEQTHLERILIVYPSDSLSKVKQIAYQSLKAERIPQDGKYMRLKEFIDTFNDGTNVNCVPFDQNRPSVMVQSSGTTGKPKTIVHSDLSATAYAKRIAYADMPVEHGKTLLVLLPPWIAYAIGGAIITPLALGVQIILSPTFGPNAIINYLGKFTSVCAAPFNYRYLKDNYWKLTKKKRDAVGKIECLISGGDKIPVKENMELEKRLGTVLVNGYGCNEGWGCLTVNSYLHNKYGTVGIPKYGDTVIAYDSERQKELPYGESGEICVLTDTMFLYYESNQEETNLVKKLHDDGKVWLHTGDIGFIDEDGFLTLNGRARRVIVRRAFKISAYTIEDKICEHPAVKECVAVEVDDAVEEHVPMAYVVLNDSVVDQSSIKQSILEKCNSELKEYEIPKYLHIVEKLPYTPNGKYDFRLLEKQGNDFVNNLNKGK